MLIYINSGIIINILYYEGIGDKIAMSKGKTMRMGMKAFFKIVSEFITENEVSIIIGFILSLLFFVFNSVSPFLTRFLIDKVFAAMMEDLLIVFLVLSVSVLVIVSGAGLGSNFILVRAF